MIHKKKKKNHGGLKFLAVVATIVLMIIGLSMTSHSEFGKRVLGHRQDRRVERTALTPRFGFASAKVKITVGEYYNNAGDPVDLTSIRNLSIDHQSQTAKSEVSIERTSTELAPGVNARPFNAINATFTEIMTKNHRYESPKNAGQPWTWYPVDPYYYGTEIDEHYIPMVDDIMGFELGDLPSKPMVAEPQSGLRSSLTASVVRPQVGGPAAPSAVKTSYTYDLTLESYRRAVPILAGRSKLFGPDDTPVTLTIGFDDVGLLRYADVSMASSVAVTLAQELGDGGEALYHYTMSVDGISGDPISIDVPTNVIDAPAQTP
jgi:hypothetical protein